MKLTITASFLLLLLTTGAPTSSAACSGQLFSNYNVPGVSGGCVSSSHNGQTCIEQQGSLPCKVNGQPLKKGSKPTGPAARAILHKKASSHAQDYAGWASSFTGGTPDYAQYQSGYMSSNVVGDGGNGQYAQQYSQAMSYVDPGNAYRQQGGKINGGAYMHSSHRGCENGHCYRNRNLAETEGDGAEAEDGVTMNWAAVGLQGDCSGGCVANIYDTSECTDDSLRPLSPLASITYYTNDADMSAGNATLPGTVEDFVGKALLFHNDMNGEFNVDNGLDACGIFDLVTEDDVAAAADGTATSSANALEAVLPFAAASIFFFGGMLL